MNQKHIMKIIIVFMAVMMFVPTAAYIAVNSSGFLWEPVVLFFKNTEVINLIIDKSVMFIGAFLVLSGISGAKNLFLAMPIAASMGLALIGVNTVMMYPADAIVPLSLLFALNIGCIFIAKACVQTAYRKQRVAVATAA